MLLFDYTSGALLRAFSSNGVGLGQIAVQCEGLRFSTDGRCILASEHKLGRISVFSVPDGSFVRHVGAGVLAKGYKDVEVMQDGALLVADYGNHRVCVFSVDGSLLTSFGAEGTAPGCFVHPTTLSFQAGRLFVLDENSTRVQVFS